MHRIPLPVTPRTHGLVIGLLLVATLLALLSPLHWPWRLAGAVAILLTGATSWLHHLARRPAALLTQPGGGLDCRLQDGAASQVLAVHLGAVNPLLVSARLEHATGRCDVWVPGWELDAETHTALRRALIGFRTPAATSSGAEQPQSDVRRGA